MAKQNTFTQTVASNTTQNSYTSTDSFENEEINNKDYELNVEIITKNVTVDINNNVMGDGIFDELMETATKHLQAQFDSGRIRNEEFGTAYLGIFTAVLNASIQLALEKNMQKQAVLSQVAQRELIKSQIIGEIAKKNIYDRQRKGFDDEARHKILKTMLDSWSVGYSINSGASELDPPNPVNKTTIDGFFQTVLNTLNNVPSTNS